MHQLTRATDRPLADPAHDDFQRAKFAQRIAETLLLRSSADSIVLGLYGKWGELLTKDNYLLIINITCLASH